MRIDMTTITPNASQERKDMKPIDRENEIRFLFEEKRERRTEIVAYLQAQQNAVLAFIVFFGTLAGLYANPAILGKELLRTTVMFIGTQIIYYLSIYIFSQMSLTGAQGGYVAAIEQRINELAGRNLALWENVGSMQYAWRGPMIVAFIIMACLMMAAWIFCIFLIFTTMPTTILITVISVETILLVALAYYGARENPRVAKAMRKEFCVEQT